MFNTVRTSSTALRQLVKAAVLASSCIVLAPSVHASTSLNLASYLQCRSTKLVEFPGTIVEAAVATPELSTLVSLVTSANLVDALSGSGPFTVFAPTNDAFAKVPAPLLGLIGGSPELLTTVLTYHVTTGTVDPRRTLTPMQIKTLQGQTVYVGYDRDGASINQSVTPCKGVKTSNGTVWLIDSVLLPQFK